jgi:hypothetical protein
LNPIGTTNLEITPVVLALIATVPAILTGVATLISVVMMAKKQAIVTAKTTDKLDQIHVLVNSRLSEALGKIDGLQAALEVEQEKSSVIKRVLDKPATT